MPKSEREREKKNCGRLENEKELGTGLRSSDDLLNPCMAWLWRSLSFLNRRKNAGAEQEKSSRHRQRAAPKPRRSGQRGLSLPFE